MADMMSKTCFGAKENVESAKSHGKIDEYDILLLDNKEFGWIDRNGETVIATPRTQQDWTLNGTSLGALNPEDVIPAGKSLDEIMAMITQKSDDPTLFERMNILEEHIISALTITEF